MQIDQAKIGLVLDEFFWKAKDSTALTVAELSLPFDRGDTVRCLTGGTRHEIISIGFRPKRGGMDGILRSELSREASMLIKGKTLRALTGQFLILDDIKVVAWILSVRVDQVFLERLSAPGVPDVLAVMIDIPIVVRSHDRMGRIRAVGVMVPSKAPDGAFTADVRMLTYDAQFEANEELSISLGSPAIASEPIFACTVMKASARSDLDFQKIAWGE